MSLDVNFFHFSSHFQSKNGKIPVISFLSESKERSSWSWKIHYEGRLDFITHSAAIEIYRYEFDVV